MEKLSVLDIKVSGGGICAATPVLSFQFEMDGTSGLMRREGKGGAFLKGPVGSFV